MPRWLSRARKSVFCTWHGAWLVSLLAALSLSCPVGTAVAEEITPESLEHFEREVRPLLAQRCYSCHSSRSEKIESGLRLDHKMGVLEGGTRGPAVIPGDPGASLLLRAVTGTEPGLSMPPGENLSTLEVQSLVRWIREGAPDPREEPDDSPMAEMESASKYDFEGPRQHWSFLPLSAPEVPQVDASDRVRDPIDAFVLETLVANRLTLAPEADLRTLARRAHQILIGLPLGWQRQQALLASTDPQVFEKFIDELLASPAFGERWARWWLDLARYADSNGLDENLAFGEAWRYRDYVIRSFNNDKPYDQFLIEQIAGDLLPEGDQQEAWRDQRIATGFLVLGPKMLAEQDETKLAIDVVDEQLDVTTRTFLGMTVGCARCHDHKFDPIPARDYYAMAGIFRSTSTMENLKTVAKWREISLETATEKKVREQWEAQRGALAKELETAKKQLRENLEGDLPHGVGQHLLSAADAMRQIAISDVTQVSSTSLGENRSNYGSEQIPVLHSVNGGIQQATWKLQVPAPGRWSIDVRYAAKDKRPMRLLVNGEMVEKTALATVTGGWTTTDLRWESQAQIELEAGPVEIRLERDGVVPHLDRIRLVPAEGWPTTADPWIVSGWVDFLTRPAHQDDPLWGAWIEFMNLKLDTVDAVSSWWQEAVTAQQSSSLSAEAKAVLAETIPTQRAAVTAIYQRLVESAEVTGEQQVAALQPISAQLRSAAGPWFEPLILAEKSAPVRYREPIAQIEAKLATKDANKPPAAIRALGVQDGMVADIPVHIRGSHLRLAKETVPRGALEVVDHLVPAMTVGDDSSGRLEFARWMTHPEHPSTSRVAVNRLWLEVFGEGLVQTPSNFGFRGGTPSHPELLDLLALDFVGDGWSIKRMLRRIMLSSTWRQQVIEDPVADETDPGNRLLWRQNRQRLRAEAIRDSVLSVSGMLDPEMGGTLLMTGNRGYVTNDQSNNQARYDEPRRSIYLPVIRNAMYELFSAFDYNDPSAPIAQRPSTVVPHQALFFLNSPMVYEAAGKIARDIREASVVESERIQLVFHRILGRDATDREVDRGQVFMTQATAVFDETMEEQEAAEISAWQAYCQTILSSSEFIYLD